MANGGHSRCPSPIITWIQYCVLITGQTTSLFSPFVARGVVNSHAKGAIKPSRSSQLGTIPCQRLVTDPVTKATTTNVTTATSHRNPSIVTATSKDTTTPIRMTGAHPQHQGTSHITHKVTTTGTFHSPAMNNGEANKMRDSQSDILSIACFNCKGFKASTFYIRELLNERDIICLSETWLRPGELSFIVPSLTNIPSANSLGKDDIIVFSKSGMEHVEAGHRGRPFGGVSIICKNNPELLYSEIESLSDEMIAASVSNANSIVLVIVVSLLTILQTRRSHSNRRVC